MRLIDADALEEKGVQFTDTNVYIPIEAVWNAPTVEAVVLPCKPGTTVYEILNNTDACLDCDHRYFSYAYDDEECEHPEHRTENPSLAKFPVCEKHFLEIVSYPTTERQLFNHRERFGKTVFLTREEAEAALAKMDLGV